MYDAFKKLPPQLEWAFPALLGYCTYLFFISSGLILILILLTALIILNGWISSHASSEIYSDFLLIIDSVAIAIYFCMALSLHSSMGSALYQTYWIFSAALCVAYMIWDIVFLTMLKDEKWRNKFKLYIKLMGVYTILFLALSYADTKKIIPQMFSVVLGVMLWLSVLIKWHWDKLKNE